MKLFLQKHPILSIFCIALGIRLVAYVFFNVLLFKGEFEHPDSAWYYTTGLQVAEVWKSGWYFSGDLPYLNLLAFIYTFLPASRIWPELVNILASSLTAVIAYKSIWRLTTKGRASWTAGLLITLDPYQIYLSTQFLRDSLIILAVALVFYGLVCKGRGIFLFLGFLATGLLRYKFAVIALPFLVYYLVRGRLDRKLYIWLLPAVVGILIHFGPGLLIEVERIATYVAPPIPAGALPGEVESDTGRTVLYEGEIQPHAPHTEFFQPRAVYSVRSALSLQIPPDEIAQIFVEALLYPYPWEADNSRELAFVLYILFWYGVLGLLVLASSTSLQYLRTGGWLLATGISLTVALTFAVPGIGSSIRWRMPCFYFLLLAGGLATVYLPTPKRLLDLFLSSLVLVLSSPIWLPVAFLLLVTRGQILFRQVRIGKNEENFTIYKFITMREGADGTPVGDESDKRITRLGKFLRATAIDELPELLNVIKGDMSLVGPRPHAIWEHNEVQEMLPEWKERCAVLPGLMGLAQYKCHRSDLVTKLYWDLQYIREYSLWLDIRLIFLGVWTSLRREWV